MACSTGPTFLRAAFAAAILILPVFALSADAAPPSSVSIPTGDAFPLVAVYAPPAPGRGVIVMLHGLASDKGEYNTFADAARARGWGTLAYDARGHADSARGRAPAFRLFGSGGPGTPWDRMPQDLGAVIKFLNDAGVPMSSVTVMGASLGANVAARYASRGARLKGLVLLSPGLNYVEFRPESDMASIACPTLIVVSDTDKYAFLSSRKLRALNPAIDFWSDVKPGHGVGMFDPELSARLFDWMATR